MEIVKLAEAIEHCYDVAKSTCDDCSKEHLQLAEWLKLLLCYEDTKLQPEQVEKLKEKNKALSKENRKLKKEMLKMMKYAWYNQEDEDEQE